MTFLSKQMLTLSVFGRFSVPIAMFVLMLASKSALATCGDYLLHRDMNAVSAPKAMAELVPESIPGKSCDGPHCRQSPSSPIVPAGPVEWTTHCDPAVIVMPSAGSSSSSFQGQTDGDMHGRIGYPEGIERPPCSC